MFTSILIIEINHARHLRQFRRLLGPNFQTNLHFGELTFEREIKSMESSSTLKFTHDVDYMMCKFHVSNTFHGFDFSPEISPSIMQIDILAKFGTESLPKCFSSSDVLHNLFLLSNGILSFI